VTLERFNCPHGRKEESVRWDGFKDEAVKIQTEMDEEVELDRVVIQMRGKKGVTLHYADVGVGK